MRADAASITAAGAAARSGLSAAVHAGTVRPSEAAAAAKVISRAEAKLAADGTASGGDLGTALAEVAAQAPAYTSPRVHVLFPQLAVNLDRRPLQLVRLISPARMAPSTATWPGTATSFTRWRTSVA